MRSPPSHFGALGDEEQAALRRGEHEAVASRLAEQGRHALAGWVYEQVWAFEAAMVAYRDGGQWLDALRAALEASSSPAIDELLTALPTAPDEQFDGAVALLRKAGRNMDEARLLASRTADPDAQAEALLRAGNTLAAAKVLSEAGRPRDALEALAIDPAGGRPGDHALAASLAWALGDAEGAARHAQVALRALPGDKELAALLARALGSLGHDLAAQLVLQRHGATVPADDAVPGRYRVTGMLAGTLAGAAYVGVDRLTLQEVELHLLLADQPEPVDPRLVEAIARFCAAASTAATPGHPAIRPIVRAEPQAGLLVVARAEGPSVRTMIRPPGLREAVPRARALVAFMLEGLRAAHRRGLVHGALLPSTIMTDPLGRPQLGPFGAHHLSGLAATRTGGLEELMVMTAPELRTGADPTARSDLYAVGMLLFALLCGELARPQAQPEVLEALGPVERQLVLGLTDPDPAARPSADEALAQLRTPVADLRDLGTTPTTAARSATDGQTPWLTDGIEITAADSWTVELLEALCATENPWLQPVLERHERTLLLAPWPERTRGIDASVPDWSRLVPAAALELDGPLRDALKQRLQPSAVVVTPAGSTMLALDDLLTR